MRLCFFFFLLFGGYARENWQKGIRKALSKLDAARDKERASVLFVVENKRVQRVDEWNLDGCGR